MTGQASQDGWAGAFADSVETRFAELERLDILAGVYHAGWRNEFNRMYDERQTFPEDPEAFFKVAYKSCDRAAIRAVLDWLDIERLETTERN